jgi:hypothetical protein
MFGWKGRERTRSTKGIYSRYAKVSGSEKWLDPSAPFHTRACLILSSCDSRFCRPSFEWNRRRWPQVLLVSSLPRWPLSLVPARASSSGTGLRCAGVQARRLIVGHKRAGASQVVEMLAGLHGWAVGRPAQPSYCEAVKVLPTAVLRPARSVLFFNLQQAE